MELCGVLRGIIQNFVKSPVCCNGIGTVDPGVGFHTKWTKCVSEATDFSWLCSG